MFGWLKPKCPLGTWEKTWTETRMRWLADQLGVDRLLKATVILPDEDYFPEPYDGSEGAVRRLMERVAGYMGVDPGPIRLEVCADEQLPGAAGHYDASEGVTVRVAASQLASPQRLVATLAHELAHQILLGGGLLDADRPDHEWVTDLLPVFLGIGVFAANSVIREQYGQTGHTSWWVIGRQGYLPARIFGYAFALFAFVRGEERPAWANELRLDAAESLRTGLVYLRKTGDTLFHPDSVHRPRPTPSVNELMESLRTGTPSVRLAALWDLREREPTAELVQAAADLLTDPDPDIPGEAAVTLGAMGPPAFTAVPKLCEALKNRNAATRSGAARALGDLATQPDAVVPELCALLGDEEPTVVRATVNALRHFGPLAEPAVPRLMDALASAVVRCADAESSEISSTIRAVAPDTGSALRRYTRARDPELRRLIIAALREC